MTDYALVRYAIYAEGELIETNDPELDAKADKPILLKIGEGIFPAEVEEKLKENDSVEVELDEEKNPYGPRDRSKIRTFSTRDLRRILRRRPKVGDEIRVGNETGVVIYVDGKHTLVDFNHPLAGKKLKYVVKVVERLSDKVSVVKRLVYNICDAIKPDEVEVSEEEETLIIKLPPKRDGCPLLDVVASRKIFSRGIAKKLERRKPIEA